MLTYNMEERKTASMYDYLYSCIKADIRSGKLSSGEKLPSKRTLSQHLKVSVITVQNAYALLEDEGYIYAVQKKGYFVSRVETVGSKEKPRQKSPKASAVSSESTNEEIFLDLVNNRTESSLFPFSVWSRLMRLVLSEGDRSLLALSPNGGIKELRAAIAGYLYSFRGMDVSPEQIIVGAGTEYLYDLIIKLLGRDKVFALENPGYSKIAKIYSTNDVSYKYLDIDGNGIPADKLTESRADVVHISPSHHYPTGIITPISRRQELLYWAGEGSSRYIIEDDYDSELRFAARPIDTMFGIDTCGKVIYVNTFSKTLCPSMRISYMVLPEKLLETFRKKLGFYACTVPVFEQYTLAKFISEGYFEKHISRMKNHYRTLRDCTISAIESSAFASKVTIREEKAGLHFLLHADTRFSDAELKEKALSRGIRISCLSDYLMSESKLYDGNIVINYSGIDVSKLRQAAERISEVFGLV